MKNSWKIVNHLRNQTVPVEELVRIYDDFMQTEYCSGFERGCDYIRTMITKQRADRQNSIDRQFREILQQIEDQIDESENN